MALIRAPTNRQTWSREYRVRRRSVLTAHQMAYEHPRGPAGRAVYTAKMMTADRCAQIIIEAARRRKREIVMGPGLLAIWLKLIAPGWVDKLTIETFLRPAINRVSGAK